MPGGLDQALPLFLHVLGEFHNQNGVLGRKADDGQKAHLKIHVVGLPKNKGRKLHPDDAKRHYQHDRKGYGPAFIKSGQTQEHHQKGYRVQGRGLLAGQFFLQGNAGPLKAYALGQLSGDFFHRGHGLARALAGHGLAQQFHGGQAVKALQPGRGGLPGVGVPQQGGKRHHAANGITHIPFVQIFRYHARVRLGLQIDLLDPALVHKVVDVGAAPAGLQGFVDVAQGNAERARLGLVHVDAELGHVFQTVGPGIGQHVAVFL